MGVRSCERPEKCTNNRYFKISKELWHLGGILDVEGVLKDVCNTFNVHGI